MNIQFKKGILDLCVLSLLNKKDCYGYELVQIISKHITISEGTIYPLLRKMTKVKYAETYLKESLEGPPRKYYRITDEGRKMLGQLQNEWLEFVDNVKNILFEEDDDE